METAATAQYHSCYFCHSPSLINPSQVTSYQVVCTRCGNFKISSRAEKILRGIELSNIQRANISGYIRESQGIIILENDLGFLESLPTPSVAEKGHKLFRQIANEHPTAGEEIILDWSEVKESIEVIQHFETTLDYVGNPEITGNCERWLRWAAVSWASTGAEFVYILMSYLVNAKSFLQTSDHSRFSITTVGWDYIENFRTNGSESTTAFTAMWFDDSVNSIWLESIKPAIEGAGYNPVRIDKKEHNNRIDDEIVAGIRACKFLVADFTGQRGGVYFEAGLAQGLGKQVIWLCRKDEINNVHFDTRQYNFILWEDGKLSELKTALQNRIEATIGRGNFRKV